MRRGALWISLFALLTAGDAAATWSIVAIDPATREVGIAGASCIAGAQEIAGLAPGRGAIAAQAMANFGAATAESRCSPPAPAPGR